MSVNFTLFASHNDNKGDMQLFYASVSLLENLPDHDALVAAAAELLGPTGWTSRYVLYS